MRLLVLDRSSSQPWHPTKSQPNCQNLVSSSCHERSQEGAFSRRVGADRPPWARPVDGHASSSQPHVQRYEARSRAGAALAGCFRGAGPHHGTDTTLNGLLSAWLELAVDQLSPVGAGNSSVGWKPVLAASRRGCGAVVVDVWARWYGRSGVVGGGFGLARPRRYSLTSSPQTEVCSIRRVSVVRQLDRPGWFAVIGGLLVDAAMWSMRVEVRQVLVEKSVELSQVPDELPRQPLGCLRSLFLTVRDPSFGERVGVRRLWWCWDRVGADRGEHVVERPFELVCAVADHEPGLVVPVHWQVSCGLGRPGAVRVGGDPGEVDPAGVEPGEEQDAVAARGDGVDGEEVRGDHRFGLRRDEGRPRRSRPVR